VIYRYMHNRVFFISGAVSAVVIRDVAWSSSAVKRIVELYHVSVLPVLYYVVNLMWCGLIS
jgi:hypothetical protein